MIGWLIKLSTKERFFRSFFGTSCNAAVKGFYTKTVTAVTSIQEMSYHHSYDHRRLVCIHRHSHRRTKPENWHNPVHSRLTNYFDIHQRLKMERNREPLYVSEYWDNGNHIKIEKEDVKQDSARGMKNCRSLQSSNQKIMNHFHSKPSTFFAKNFGKISHDNFGHFDETLSE